MVEGGRHRDDLDLKGQVKLAEKKPWVLENIFPHKWP
jgi:hypothetical protein